jgi:hypothetical protein
MRVDISKITSAIKKISDLTSGDKQIPGVLLNLSKVDETSVEGKLQVCYSDGHKSMIEEIDVTVEEADRIGGFTLSYEQFIRAIDNCQPSGIIKVNEMTFTFLPNNIVRLSANQSMEIKDNEGNVVGAKELATKKMDLVWTEPGSDMKSSILVRMKYNEIFEGDNYDTYDKAELIDDLSRTSTEKGRLIYVSANVQSIFVANQAHVTSVPVSRTKELSIEEQDELRGTLVEQGVFTEEKFKDEVNNQEKRIHQSLVISQQMAKAIIGVLGKTSADTVQMYRSDKYCNIFIDTDTEKVGIWFEMAQASKAHVGSLERYNSLEYKNYQLLFFREFLSDTVKSALNSTKSEKIQMKFSPTELEQASSALDLVIASGSASASIADTYRINPEDIIDVAGDLKDRTFTIALKIFSDMLAQLKTNMVALDINIGEGDTVCIRLSEVDIDKYTKEYTNAREQLKAELGDAFDASSTPTPIEKKQAFRLSTLKTKQYTMLSK